MASKRMFDKAIVDTDRFMDMPMSAKALYFLLGMEADDEGFVSYKKVMRIHGGNEDDANVLIAKKFVIRFPSGVVVITDWNKNNWLDSRRMKPTEYQTEKNQLSLTGENTYVLSTCSASIEESRGVESRIEHIAPGAGAGVPEIIKAFEVIDPKNKTYYGNKTQRAACEFLLAEYGLEKVLARIAVLPRTNVVRFLPHITTPLQLRDKWVQLENDMRRKMADKVESDQKYRVAFS